MQGDIKKIPVCHTGVSAVNKSYSVGELEAKLECLVRLEIGGERLKGHSEFLSCGRTNAAEEVTQLWFRARTFVKNYFCKIARWQQCAFLRTRVPKNS